MEGQCNMIELEDNIKYFITKEIQDGSVVYVYLTNVNDVNDFCIRKTDESREELKELDSVEEFKYALKVYQNNME